MAASARTCLVVAALACALTLALHTADAQADEGQKPKCASGAAMPCRVGALRDPENQEEEGLLNVKVPSSAADDDYSDPDQPKDPDESDGDDLVVLGH
ncbi:uncharacterized protein LOC119322043 [Triticum dicoccoides]|uniref:uncharacterized protein LOC119322043 n=1 Tax=Triticum dicoccoides TaxID=85692 RepID=UPI000E7B89AC|nr:uncharacterized protein LOC119322043 [Triticum dicoccoides]